MDVEKSHHIDKSEPDADGMYEYYYDYHVYEFTEGDLKLVARSYENEPEAHFLRWEKDGKKLFVTKSILNDHLMKKAIEYLKNEGKSSIRYLDEDIGYVEI